MLKPPASMSTKTGTRAAVADGVGRGDEGVADRDDLVAGPDAERRAAPGAARSVQFETAQAWAAPTQVGELALERGDLRPLGQPAREITAAAAVGLLGPEQRLGDRDHAAGLRTRRRGLGRATRRRGRATPCLEAAPSARKPSGCRGGAGVRPAGAAPGSPRARPRAPARVRPAHGAASIAGEVEQRGLGARCRR